MFLALPSELEWLKSSSCDACKHNQNQNLNLMVNMGKVFDRDKLLIMKMIKNHIFIINMYIHIGQKRRFFVFHE